MPTKMPNYPAMIRSGDLVFRQGRGIFSGIFRNVGNVASPFSHVGILYIESKNIFVIHTEASELTGVGFAKKEPLSKFISNRNAKSYKFYRVVGLDSSGINTMLKTALKYVRDKVPFDTEFNLKDSGKLYCTELVYKAYKTARINLVKKPSVIQVPTYYGIKEIETIPIGLLVKSSVIKPIQYERGD